MKSGKVRPIAIGVLRQGNSYLVHQGYDDHKQQTFYRPLGGKIEFAEPAAQTVAREYYEEIGREVTNPRYLLTLENIFVFNGLPMHEIVLVFQVDFADPADYARGSFHLAEAGDPRWLALWIDISEFSPETPLYPQGLLEYLESHP